MRAFAVVAACALLCACERPRHEPLFPLHDGAEWEYRVSTQFEDPGMPSTRERLVVHASGPFTIEGAPTYRRSTATGANYWLRSDASGVYRVARQGPLDALPLADQPVRFVLKQPIAVGTTWEADTVPYVLQHRNEVPRELRHVRRYQGLAMKYRIEQVGQAVRVPAGEFSGCVQVQGRADIYLMVDELLALRPVPLVTREWYCPRAGLVKLERVEHSPTKFIVGGTTTFELLSWR